MLMGTLNPTHSLTHFHCCWWSKEQHPARTESISVVCIGVADPGYTRLPHLYYWDESASISLRMKISLLDRHCSIECRCMQHAAYNSALQQH